MTDIGAPGAGTYMSDAEIIAWVQQKSDAQYGELRDVMHATDARGKLTKDLAQLKADLNGKSPNSQDIVDEMNAIKTTWADTEYADDVNALLDPMLAKLAPVPDPGIAGSVDLLSRALNAGNRTGAPLSDSDIAQIKAQIAEAQQQTVLPSVSGFKQDFSDKIDVQTEQFGRVDQLALLQIQELVGDARQTEQLGSNILSSRSQASNAIVGNIRG